MNGDFENQNGQNESQENAQNQKVKLRLRLKSGEEFEAEGSLNFVLAQKAEFLTKNGVKNTPLRPTPLYTTPQAETPTYNLPPRPLPPTPQETQPQEQSTENIAPYQQNPVNNEIGRQNANLNTMPRQDIPISKRYIPDYNTQVPAIRWHQNQPQNVGENTPTEKTPWQIDEKIWFKIAYLDGADLILRRKVKDLKPNLAALITLAAAKMIGGITKMSALELSKSLRLSGYLKGDERLDRILAPEIKAGTLFFEGSKRKRE